MFNFRSFVHFVKLRRAHGAQKEICDIANEMVRLVKETGAFKYSLEAWGID
jgi:thymidylate synthase ThyX